MTLLRKKQGFTLIELVIVLVLIGILAAVAIPQFHNLNTTAQQNSIKGTLGNVRSAINLWRANQIAQGSTSPGWPNNVIVNVQTPNALTITTTKIPANPFATASGTASVVLNVATTRGTVANGANGGWNYNETTGEFWANSDTGTTDENTW